MRNDAILAERFNDYGKFTDNMELVDKLQKKIVVSSWRPIEGVLKTAVNFTILMLALKAARSLSETISPEALADCVTDFNNYIYLLESNYNVKVELGDPFIGAPEGQLVNKSKLEEI